MEDRSLAAEWTNQTALHPLGLAAILILGLLAFVLPRRYAVLPLLIMSCFIAPGQRVIVGGADFTLLRIMVLFTWIRIVIRGESRGVTLQLLDGVVLAAGLTELVAFTLQYSSMQAFIRQLGGMFDLVGMYFCFRFLIRNWRDFDRAMLAMIIISIPVAISFLIEAATGRNAFAIFGGVPEITPIRQGRLRCQGAFPHPILAGCFWASFIPIFASRWWRPRPQPFWGALGVGTSLVIVYTCASSTPLMGVVAAGVGAFMFLLRNHLRVIRWGIVVVLTCLHFVMTMPVWHLISRVNILGGSTGWHRYYLIDQAIHHVGEWWLFGARDTSHWGLGLQDVTNHYVLQGVRGGMATLILFIASIVVSFAAIGRMTRATAIPALRVATWALGVALFVHCINFIGVSYFGQVMMSWYLLLAAIAALAPAARAAAPAPAQPRTSAPPHAAHPAAGSVVTHARPERPA